MILLVTEMIIQTYSDFRWVPKSLLCLYLCQKYKFYHHIYFKSDILSANVFSVPSKIQIQVFVKIQLLPYWSMVQGEQDVGIDKRKRSED